MGENGATHAPMPKHAAPDQGARELAIIVLTFVNVVPTLITLGIESAVTTQKAREECTTHTATPQHAARDECADDFLFVASAFLPKSFLPFIALGFSFVLGTKEMSEERPTHAPPPKHSTANQGAHELLLVSAFLTNFLGLFAVACFAVLVEQTRDDCST
jgi:hypothetical protein